MRWKLKVKEYKHVGMIKYVPTPNIGDRKEVIKFALFPTKLDKENIIWLERYIITYEYKNIKYKCYNINKDSYLSTKYELCGGIFRPYIWLDAKDWKLIEKKFYN